MEKNTTLELLKQNKEFKICLVEDTEVLKAWNYAEPVVQIYNSVTSFLLPCSRLCYTNLKREIDESSRKTEGYIKMLERHLKTE